MKRSSPRLRSLASIGLLCSGLLAGGAFAADCGVVEACPMRAMRVESHCGGGAAVVENCCPEMSASSDPVDLPLGTLVSAGVPAWVSATPVASVESATSCAAPVRSRPPDRLYTLHSALLI